MCVSIMKRVLSGVAESLICTALCSDVYDMQISEAVGGVPEAGTEPCRFPKLEECAHFHYERVNLPQLTVTLQTSMDQSLHSQHANDDDGEFHMVQVTSGDECWLLQRNLENFKMLDAQLHQCIYDRKISHLIDLSTLINETDNAEEILKDFLDGFSSIADNSVNCGPVLNWLQMDNKGHRLLVPSEESRSINTPAVAAAYSVRRYVSQARDELNLEVGDMISVIDMASPGESVWWKGKRGFQVGFFPQHCVHIIGDKVPRNMPLPPPVVGSLALSPIKPVLRKHGKIIAFFRSFILNRPSRRRLKQSGILKERVFGCDLGEHLLNSGHDIPTVLVCCAEFIEKNGIVDGIYRLSGVTSNIQKLRNAFDEDRIPNLHTEEILQDIHSVASLLKMYFRELPNPLCTYQLYQSFVNAVQGCNNANRSTENDKERLLKMRETVQKLPPPHYRTLEYLMRHLARVAKHGSNTGMTTRNVAIVWAPNLLRCAELEIGGVAALQGVGVQAVVTEFLICYADLIFCDHLPNLDQPLAADTSPKRSRPKSLAISTPAKLITLEEARSKHSISKGDDCSYIEVGGGPKNLPKQYHTVIDLPHRKRPAKRSPGIGWRSFFSKSRGTSSQNSLNKTRKASVPEKSVTESDLTDMRRILRSVKSAESLTSGHSEPANNEDILGPLHSLIKPSGHNRSVSHDSYFDTIQNSQNNSEGSLLDLSEIQMNFELEESEMRIFSEDESLVSSPRIQKEAHRRILTRARPEDFNSAANSSNPSPKKQARVIMSPDSMSRKRTRLEDQLSDIQYIDCSTPDNATISTTAVIHASEKTGEENESYQPKNKSPRSSAIETYEPRSLNVLEAENKRQSLNLEATNRVSIPKSLTEIDIVGKSVPLTTPTPQSPNYRQLIESSAATTPGLSPDASGAYQAFKYSTEDLSKKYENYILKKPKSPKYENVLTTISITYKSPSKSIGSPRNDSIYEDVLAVNTEKAMVPTSTASLPVQEAAMPTEKNALKVPEEQRPKSLSALEDFGYEERPFKSNSNPNSIYKQDVSQPKLVSSSEYTASSSKSSDLNLSDVQTAILHDKSNPVYQYMENPESPTTDFSLSEIVNTSSENLHSSQSSISFPVSPSQISPNVSPTHVGSSEILTSPSSTDESLKLLNNCYEKHAKDDFETNRTGADLETNLTRAASFNLIEFSPTEPEADVDKRKTIEGESNGDDNDIYQQVKYYRRSIHETNSLIELDHCKNDLEMNSNHLNNSENSESNATTTETYEETKKSPRSESLDSLEAENLHLYENVDENKSNRSSTVYENVDFSHAAKQSNVKSLLNKFESKTEKNASKPIEKDVLGGSTTSLERKSSKPKKSYAKDGLPPCLRAKNLRHATKTRSLDEEAFQKEFGTANSQRRISLDETAAYKLNSVPKKLNDPKTLPESNKNDPLHAGHVLADEKLNRERIEEYKEKRRTYFRDLYRSESFKEDKEITRSRFKVFKNKDETDAKEKKEHFREVNEEEDEKEDEEKVAVSSRESFRLRAAKFENQNYYCRPKTLEMEKGKAKARWEEKEDFLRAKRREEDSVGTNERRRHTFESKEERERETETERLKRTSLENRTTARKEKASPTYCIKDMKAIFESKSHQ